MKRKATRKATRAKSKKKRKDEKQGKKEKQEKQQLDTVKLFQVYIFLQAFHNLLQVFQSFL